MPVLSPGRGLIPLGTAEELHVYLAHGIAAGNFSLYAIPSFRISRSASTAGYPVSPVAPLPGGGWQWHNRKAWT